MICFATRRFALVPAALAASGAALAADLEAKSRVDSVVVYPDAAQVSRVADVSLPAGATTLVFRGLPMSLDPASLRVEGAGGAPIAVGSVEARVAPAPPQESQGEGRMKKLRAERDGWQGTLDALEAKKAMMLHFADAGPKRLSAGSQPLDIGQWNSAWDTVGAGLAKVGDQLVAARASAKAIDDEMAALAAARQRPPSSTTREAAVDLSVDLPTDGTLKLVYRVAGAGWEPAYDARLATGAGGGKASLELVRRATVSQRSGEDWTGAQIVLSTTRAKGGAQAPEVQTQRATFWEPPVVFAPSAGLAQSPPRMAKSMAAPQTADSAAPPPLAAQEQQASLDATAWQVSFVVPGRVDVPGDGSARSLRVSTTSYAPDLLVKTAPALEPTAYLQARIVNAEDAPLLPGAVNISRDGAFVGVSRIGLVAPGDAVEVGFGADDRVKVTRVPVRRRENEPVSANQSKTEQREFRTTVKNLHDFPIKAVVVDQTPISENTAIAIDLAPATTPPTDKNVGDRRGVMDWVLDLPPGAEKSLTLAYRMKWPADRDVVFGPAPGGR